MANIVVGSFSTESEAAEMVRDLENKGYKEEDITLLTSKGSSNQLDDQTDIQVENVGTGNKENESFMDKIKRALIQDVGPENNLSTVEKLISYGLSEEQAKDYSRGLEAGNIVLVANDGSGEFNRMTAPIADDNIDSLDRTGRTNLADDDLESVSGYQNITADDREPETESEEPADSDSREEEVLEENPVLNKSTQERDGRSL